MANPVGRYVVPLLDGNKYFTVGHLPDRACAVQHFVVAVGKFSNFGTWDFSIRAARPGCDPSVCWSKGVAMPDGGSLPGIYAQYYKGENPVYGELPVPTRTGYAILGWSTDGTAANLVAATDPVPPLGILLKAAWEAQRCERQPNKSEWLPVRVSSSTRMSSWIW